jgi:CBS domain-containing protein
VEAAICWISARPDRNKVDCVRQRFAFLRVYLRRRLANLLVGAGGKYELMKIHEIMSADARCVGLENTLVEAAGVMRAFDVGAVPVCEDGRIVGVLTDRDIVIRGVAEGRDPNAMTVREAILGRIFCIFADAEVEEAANLMREQRVRRLPVLNREERLVGIVSLGDMAVNSQPTFTGQMLRDLSR